MIEVEQVDFVSVPTRDLPRAIAFYREVLGLPASEYSEGRARGAERDARLLEP